MPSPIIHVTTGYVLYKLARYRWPALETRRLGSVSRLLVVAVGFSMLPDVDTIFGLLLGDLGRFHNNVTHSLTVALVVAFVTATIMRLRYREKFWPWFGVVLAGYGLHVLMDAATIGRGVMALWPFTTERFQAPWMLFYGVHWSQGWLSIRHVWTLVTELALVAIVVVIDKAICSRLATVRSR